MATPDGATVAGQPEVAARWFPVNDHPLDKAPYSFDVTVPRGYEVVANGFLTDPRQPSAAGPPTSGTPANRWRRYLATIDIGFWDVHEWRTETGLPVYRRGRLRPHRRAAGRHRCVLGPAGEILDVLSGDFGPYPYSTVGASSTTRTTSSSPSRRRPGRSTRSSSGWMATDPGPERLGRRARARPPVVRRPDRAGPLAGHLAQRGLRDLCRMAVGRVRGARDDAGDLPGHLWRHSC